jgi:OmpA-OmpF porin, OOP family
MKIEEIRMRKQYQWLGLPLVLALAAPAALAEPHATGPFLGVAAGYVWTKDMSVTSPAGLRNSFDTQDGWTGVVTGGVAFENGVRPAIELGWARSTVGDIEGGLPGRAGGAGHIRSKTAMGVVYYDFEGSDKLRPYIGGGLGWAWVKYAGVGDIYASRNSVSEEERAFAWQGMAGVSYAIAEQTELTLGYRYLATEKFSVITGLNGRAETRYSSHSALVGFRHSFGAEPPRPPPAPAPIQYSEPPPPPPPAIIAPAASRNYTVFFDWDKSDLSGEGEEVLRQVAQNAKAGNIATIQVTGYADSSGAKDYNQSLSERRAESVRAYLVSLGLLSNDVMTIGKGEADQLVLTVDNVREPSNRRSVIIFPESTAPSN